MQKKKRGDGECQEGRNTRDKEGRKRKRQRREGGPEKKNTTGKKRAQAANTQSGRPGARRYRNYAVLGGIILPPADISRSTENSAIWPAAYSPSFFMGLWGSIWSGTSGFIGLTISASLIPVHYPKYPGSIISTFEVCLFRSRSKRSTVGVRRKIPPMPGLHSPASFLLPGYPMANR